MRLMFRQSLFPFLLLVGFVTLAACSGPEILNAIVPHSGYHITQDVAYGELPRQKLDIYVPDGVKNAPVIVFFHGGSWQTGSKDDYRFVGQAFASRGYVTVIPNYRLYPDVRFPTFLEDGAQAVTWAHEHIAEYDGDTDSLYVAGHSAGAYIAVMMGLESPYVSIQQVTIKGIIGMAGPYDFLPLTDPNIKDIFSTEADEKTQPVHWVSPNRAPMLLVTGDADEDVSPRNTESLTTRLRGTGNEVTERVYPGVAHIGIVLSLANGFRFKTPLLDNIDAFIAHTQKASNR